MAQGTAVQFGHSHCPPAWHFRLTLWGCSLERGCFPGVCPIARMFLFSRWPAGQTEGQDQRRRSRAAVPLRGVGTCLWSLNSSLLWPLFAGGTDIISCFMGHNPSVPVHRGEIQARNLAMAVEAWSEEGDAFTACCSPWGGRSPGSTCMMVVYPQRKGDHAPQGDPRPFVSTPHRAWCDVCYTCSQT